MIEQMFRVVYRGLDWYGLEVERTSPTEFLVGEGIIGRSERPLDINMHTGAISGGWRVDETLISLEPTDSHIDMVLYDDMAHFLIRSDNPRETYTDDIEILFPLAWKLEHTWYINRPHRGKQYEQDTKNWQHHSS